MNVIDAIAIFTHVLSAMGTEKSRTRSANVRSATAQASSVPRTASTGTTNPPPLEARKPCILAELFEHSVARDALIRCWGNAGESA